MIKWLLFLYSQFYSLYTPPLKRYVLFKCVLLCEKKITAKPSRLQAITSLLSALDHQLSSSNDDPSREKCVCLCFFALAYLSRKLQGHDFIKVFHDPIAIDVILQSVVSLLFSTPRNDLNESIALKYLDTFLQHIGSLPSTRELRVFIDEFLKASEK